MLLRRELVLISVSYHDAITLGDIGSYGVAE